MNIFTIKERTPKLCDCLLQIWERSVKASHEFLSDAETERIKAFVPHALREVQTLAVAQIDNHIVGFIGINERKIEMLFVDAPKRGQGIGKALVRYAIENYSADTVTVNEQNPRATVFYARLGFETYMRTDFDEQGGAYPLLYMKLKKENE